MRTKRCFASGLGFALVFTGSVFGQSMIEYGHGVARAGAAGAASGTGIAGIFTSMKETADDKDKKKPQYGPVNQQKPETVDAQKTRQAGEPANAPLKMTTSSGIVVSGVSPTWMGAAYNDPMRQPVRVRQVEWSNPAEKQAAEEQSEAAAAEAATVAEAAGDAPGNTAPDGHGAKEVASPGQIVKGSTDNFASNPGANSDAGAVASAAALEPGAAPQADSMTAAEAAPQPAPVTDAEIAGVKVGSSIQEAMKVLGRPSFSLKGIVGKSYTEKYVFKNAAGETITVLTWGGTVTSVSVS